MQIFAGHMHSGVNLAGIPGKMEGGSRFVGGEAVPSTEKIEPFTRNGALMHFEQYFLVRVLARKMLNFLPEVLIWWTLKMYFWKVVNTLLEYASNLVLEILKHDKICGDNLH